MYRPFHSQTRHKKADIFFLPRVKYELLLSNWSQANATFAVFLDEQILCLTSFRHTCGNTLQQQKHLSAEQIHSLSYISPNYFQIPHPNCKF